MVIDGTDDRILAGEQQDFDFAAVERCLSIPFLAPEVQEYVGLDLHLAVPDAGNRLRNVAVRDRKRWCDKKCGSDMLLPQFDAADTGDLLSQISEEGLQISVPGSGVVG